MNSNSSSLFFAGYQILFDQSNLFWANVLLCLWQHAKVSQQGFSPNKSNCSVKELARDNMVFEVGFYGHVMKSLANFFFVHPFELGGSFNDRVS